MSLTITETRQPTNTSQTDDMTISTSGIAFITEREGSSPTMYLDVAQLPTIGVGHLLTKSELNSGKIVIAGQAVHWRHGLTEHQMAQLLDQDLDRFEQAVNDAVIVPLTQNQFDALVSFAFNIGIGAFKGSTLLRRLNEGNYNQVPRQFKRWKYAGNRVINGLINRRELEAKLWAS